MNSALSVLYLPDIALEKIFSFLSFDEVAKTREVCKRFNLVAGKYLTRGFIQLEKRHAIIYKRVKSALPRRESERRLHPLARHCDILSAVETRISMLNMTFMKYIESNMCCFIPGKVIDEIERVLSLVETSRSAPRTHEFLQELRDISSMAMEHFDEHILPTLKKKPAFKIASTISKPSRVFLVQNSVAEDVKKLRKQNSAQKQQVAVISSHILQLCVRLKKQNYRIRTQAELIREQERKIQEQNTKIQEQENVIADMKKHMDEWDQKFAVLTTEIRTRSDLTVKSTSPAKFASPPAHPPPPKLFRSNIRPRTAQVLPPISSLLSSFTDVERKRKSTSALDIPPKMSKASSEAWENPFSSLVQMFNDKNISKTKPKEDPPTVKYKDPTLEKDLSKVHKAVSDTIESIIKTPLAKLRPRKRKNTDDLTLP